MIKVGIIGGAGYTAGELIRLLVHHPNVVIDFVYSTSNAGNKISHVHQDLAANCTLHFSDTVNSDIDVLFLCLGHGNSKKFLEHHEFSKDTKIIDLGNDFRLEENCSFMNKSFVYGLPESQKDIITKASYIANPGCFATAIQLALLPLAKHHMLNETVHVNAVTGATGAGTSLASTSHFAWRDNNFSYYKPFKHQHLGEIKQSIGKLQSNSSSEILFIPNRGNFSRGIFATAYTQFKGTLEAAKKLYTDYYKDAPFTVVTDNAIHLKQVVNTNFCFIHLHVEKDTLLITSIIDNLLKGASGQAVQNMNLMFGLKETTGLQLKANYF